MRIPVAKEGWLLIGTGVVLTAAVVFFWPPLAYVLGFLTVFSIFFFRDPERETVCGEGLILAPADGTVISVTPVHEESFLQGEAQRVSIFMSVFNCHVNRIPVSGRLAYHDYNPGHFALAFKDKAAEDNESNSIGIEGACGRLLVRQIAGWVARRIVWWVDVDDEVRQGQRFGMIRFGSRVDLFLPPGVHVKVKKGDRVKAGLTVVGECT